MPALLRFHLRPLLVLAAAAALAACGRTPSEPEPVRAVRTMTVVVGSAGGEREFAAEVRARTESRLGFRVAGKVTARPADVGQRVAAGQTLAQLDPEDLRQAQDAARAGLAAAEANHAVAAAEFKRFRELRDQGFISAAELDRRALAMSSAQAQLDQARAQAQVQRNQAEYSRLLAPGAGTVVATDVEVGQVVSVGTPVVRLALDGPRDAVFSVPEDGLPLLQRLVGQPGALRVRLWGEASLLPATLRELAASADPVTRTYLAKADLGKAQPALGRTATVVLSMPRVEGQVKLPLTAVTRRGAESAAWVVDPATMTVQQVPVQVAGAEGNEVVVAAGLRAGQEVVTAGVHVLTPGQKVKRYVPSSGAASLSSAPLPTASGAGPAAATPR